MRQLHITVERWPLRQSFNIARGSKITADVIHVTLNEDGLEGHGECVPYGRYGETLDTVSSQIAEIRSALEAGLSSDELCEAMPAGAARNALDCALWDLECKKENISAWQRANQMPQKKLLTAFTISLDTPENMANAAHRAAKYPLLKLKLGSSDNQDAERITLIRQACPRARLIVDANEGWHKDNLIHLLEACRQADIELVEQPLPSDGDDVLSEIDHPVPLCADETVHTDKNLHELKNRYDWVNIKLDKTGGLTHGLKVLKSAKEHGFGIMIGCMVGTSLAMAPALILANQADLIDLDGPLWLENDRSDGIIYQNGEISTPQPVLWGNSGK